MSGCQEDVENLIRETGDATQLATWCVVYKSELARKRAECRSLADCLNKARRDLEHSMAKLVNRSSELSVANGRIASLLEDVASQVDVSGFTVYECMYVRLSHIIRIIYLLTYFILSHSISTAIFQRDLG